MQTYRLTRSSSVLLHSSSFWTSCGQGSWLQSTSACQRNLALILISYLPCECSRSWLRWGTESIRSYCLHLPFEKVASRLPNSTGNSGRPSAASGPLVPGCCHHCPCKRWHPAASRSQSFPSESAEVVPTAWAWDLGNIMIGSNSPCS